MSQDRLTGTPFAIIPVWVLKEDLSDRAVRLYATIYGYVGEKDMAWPLQSTLATDLRCSLSSLKNALRELVDAGAVVRSPRHRENSNEIIGCWYEVVVKNPKAVASPLPNPSQPVGYPLGSPLPTDIDTLELDTSKNYVATPAEISTHSPSKPKKTYPPEVYELNNYLCQLIDQNGSRVPKGGEVEMDRLLRINKRAPAEVKAVIEWCQNNSFWRSNILSADKLRGKYDTLRLQAIAAGVHLPESFSPDLLERAKEWDEWDAGDSGPDTAPSFPRPQNSEGHLLDGNGRAYYIDPMQPTKRRYVDDE